MSTEELLKHAIFLAIGTAQSEGNWFGPKVSQDSIEQYIESTGGWPVWIDKYYEAYGEQ